MQCQALGMVFRLLTELTLCAPIAYKLSQFNSVLNKMCCFIIFFYFSEN